MREVPVTNVLGTEGVPTRARLQAIAFAGIGNLLELYDYLLFGIMLPTLAPLFFPTSSYVLSLLVGYIGFAISFFVTPLGAFFWGYVGDKFGRAKVLKNSLIIMAVPSLLIGCLPTYQDIGLLAPLTLFLLRIFQGFSASGETLGSKIYAMESLGEKSYGISSGLISGFGAMGVMLAMCAGLYVNTHTNIESLWRIPFFISVLLFIIGLLIRTLSYKSIVNSTKAHNFADTFNIIKSNPKKVKLVFVMGAVLGVLSYSMHVFLFPFLISVGINPSSSYRLAIIGLLSTAVSAVIAGKIFDRIQQNHSLLNKVMVISIITIIPSYIALITNIPALMLVGIICLNSSLGAFAAVSGVINFSIFPKEIRCRGVFFPSICGVCIFGGVTPLILNLAATIHIMGPAILITLFLLISLNVIRKNIA